MRCVPTVVVLLTLIPTSARIAPAAPAEPPPSASAPVVLDHNRMTVEVAIDRPGGGQRRAWAWVDTGNPFLVVTEPLARELGLQVPATDASEHAAISSSPAPPLYLGTFPLPVTGVPVLVRASRTVHEGVDAELNLPAAALRGLHVVLDYPARRLTVARPGVLTPRGTPVSCRVSPTTGLVQVEANVDGETVHLGVDNGSAGTWVSTSITETWRQRHPERARAVGAAGSANFWGLPFETTGELLRLPRLAVGPLEVTDVGVLGLGQPLFSWYSKKTPGSVAGFIGANVLARYRVEIDESTATTWWEAGPQTAPADLDIVGLTIRPEADGSFTVAGVVTRDGRPAVDGIEAGDRLLRIDDLEVTGARMGAVIDALRGSPGAHRTLIVERGGTRLTVETRTERLP